MTRYWKFVGVSVFLLGCLPEVYGHTGPAVFPARIHPLAFRASDVVTGDFNQDGYADIVAVSAQISDARLELLLHDGNGFEPSVLIPLPHQPIRAEVEDLDLDGDLDLVVTYPRDDAVGIIQNIDGELSTLVVMPAGNKPEGLCIVDLNHDGFPDIVVANRDSNDLSIYLNLGDMEFSPEERTEQIGEESVDLVAIDYDDDERTDLAVLAYTGRITLVRNTEVGSLEADGIAFSANRRPLYIESDDLNADGLPDLVVTNSDNSYFHVALNSPEGFGSSVQISTGYSTDRYGIVLRDFDFDGDIDIATMAHRSIEVWKNNGSGEFLEFEEYLVSGYGGAIAVGDFNSDGVWDLVSTHSVGERLNIRYGRADGSFYPVRSEDFGDGTRDLEHMVSPDGESDWIVLQPSGIGAELKVISWAADDPVMEYEFEGVVTRDVAVADYNNDGIEDLLLAGDYGINANELFAYFGDSNRDFNPNPAVTPLFLPYLVKAGDMNADGRMDAVVIDRDEKLTVMVGEGDGTFNPGYSAMNAGENDFGLADLDGDGDLDILLIENGLRIHWNHNMEGFSPEFLSEFSSNFPQAVEIADLNGDGHLDIVVVFRTDPNISVFFNNGFGAFSSTVDYELDRTMRDIRVADVDLDGDLDLITGSIDELIILINDGLGGFCQLESYAIYTEFFHSLPFLFPGNDYPGVLVGDEFGLLNKYENLLGWPVSCLADIVGDGVLNFFDISAYLQLYTAGDLAADLTGDGRITFFDLSAFLQAFNAGCP